MTSTVPHDREPADPGGLAELLPRWHLLRDAADAGDGEEGPLRALLAVIGEQVEHVRAGVEQQYDDLFVETAAEWVLPYLGDLVGYQPLPGGPRRLPDTPDTPDRRLAAALTPRRDVAATVGYRRRKGTLALLEELAASVAGWPARAVELSRLLVHQQPVRLLGSGTAAVNARRAGRGRYADLRDGAALDLAGTPFATAARLPDVRRTASRRRQGGYTPAGVALYVWRLRPYPVTKAPAHCVDSARNLYTFSVLGNDTPLVTRPEPEPSAAHVATIDNVPAYLRRRQVADRLADYYGPGKSFAIWVGERDGTPVPLSDIVVADLSGWRHRPATGKVAVDPELGRIAFGVRSVPADGVWVTYHYAFADDLGGGEYDRNRSGCQDPPAGARVYRVGPGQRFQRIMEAYRAYREDRDVERDGGAGPNGVIEITDSGAYQEPLDFALEPGDRLVLRAADRGRPTLRLLDWSTNRPDALNIRAGADCGPGEEPRMMLDGLLVTGRGVYVTGPVGAVTLRHCTLVPGWTLEPRCDPDAPDEPSLVLDETSACVAIDRCVLGTIQVIADQVGTDPLPVHIRDSVLDATGRHRPALSAPDCRIAHAELHAHRVTVVGEVHTHAVRIAENTLVTGRMRVARRQVGCLRFSYVPPGSRTPRRYRCQPDLAGPDEAERVRPLFTSERYGTAAYAQLAPACAEEITRGADDGAEMGAFHDLFQPQRADGLRARLAEYTPAGTDAGVIYVT